MRKSLGEKRKELSAQHIAEITKLYGAFEESDRVKIFPNEAFGYMRVTVERPLRLRWEITDETLAAVRAERKLAKLGDTVDTIVAALAGHKGLSSTERAIVGKVVVPILTAAGGLAPPQHKAFWDALAVRDPGAPAITNRKGDPEPDSELRDQENVPLPAQRIGFEDDPTVRLATIEYRSAIEDHLGTDVHPYASDAWVDHTKTKIGYEIPLARYFYKYVPPRPLQEIDAAIKQLENEIQELLREVTE
jgi:type I restriction enzyme M protein